MKSIPAMALCLALFATSVSADILSFKVTNNPNAAGNFTIDQSGDAYQRGTVTNFDGGTSGSVTFNQTENFSFAYLLDTFVFSEVGETLTAFNYDAGASTLTLGSAPTIGGGGTSVLFQAAAGTGTMTFNYTTSEDGAGAAVPEPSSFAALALCGIGYMAVRRRRRNS